MVLSSEINFNDKIAFATCFLADEYLTEFVRQSTDHCVNNGLLQGLLVCLYL